MDLIGERVLTRARLDFGQLRGNGLFQLAAGVGTSVLAVWAAFAGDHASPAQRALLAVGGVAGGTVIIGIAAFVVLVALAPVRQRDELRIELGNVRTVPAIGVIAYDERVRGVASLRHAGGVGALVMEGPRRMVLDVTNHGEDGEFRATVSGLEGGLHRFPDFDIDRYVCPLAWERGLSQEMLIQSGEMMRVLVGQAGYAADDQSSLGILWFTTPPAAPGVYSDASSHEASRPFGVDEALQFRITIRRSGSSGSPWSAVFEVRFDKQRAPASFSML